MATKPRPQHPRLDPRRAIGRAERAAAAPRRLRQPEPGRDYVIRFEIPEFTCNCPLTGQPDYARFTIDVVADKLCVELKSLKLYFWSYRNVGAFHEQVTNAILDDIVKATKPRFARITAHWNVRGGIYTSVVAEHRKKGWKPAPAVVLPRPPTASYLSTMHFVGFWAKVPRRVAARLARAVSSRPAPYNASVLPGRPMTHPLQSTIDLAWDSTRLARAEQQPRDPQCGRRGDRRASTPATIRVAERRASANGSSTSGSRRRCCSASG